MAMIRGYKDEDLVFEPDLTTDTWYRRSREHDISHLWSGEGVDTLCHVGLWLPDEFWIGSWLEEKLGEQWVVRDKRKNIKKCVGCKKQAEASALLADYRQEVVWTPPTSQTLWPKMWWKRGSWITSPTMP